MKKDKESKLEMDLEDFQRISHFRLIDLGTGEKDVRDIIKTELNGFRGELEEPERKYIQALKEEYSYPQGNISLYTNLGELGFTPMLLNVVRKAINQKFGLEGEMYLGDLIQIDKKYFLKVTSLGKKKRFDIEKVVDKTGYKLGTEFDFDRPVSEWINGK